ncbi:MAG: sugar ABC transporter substrate-binding protein [Ancalomicrobiaceae bacterium]|nr:sugar ABC transporter substrate-binding protein [Ancalomicrobiaceae bacterium]
MTPLNVLLIAATLAAAGTPLTLPATAADAKKLVFLTGPTEDRFIGTFSKRFLERAAAAGLQVTQLTSPFDPALQAQQLDDAIGQMPNMIVLQPLSSGAVHPALVRAKAAGIPVFVVISQVDNGEQLVAGSMANDEARSGTLAAEAIIQGLRAGGKATAKVAAITGTAAEGIAPKRMAAFTKRLAAEPWIKLVQVEDAHWMPAAAEQIAGQLFARYAADGGLDAIYGMNDAMANAIVQAADSAGVELGTGAGRLLIVGGGCNTSGIGNVSEHKQYATLSAPRPVDDAATSVGLITDYLAGKPIPALTVTTPLEIITPNNLAQFTEACSF